MKRIPLKELLSAYPGCSYEEQYRRILEMIEQGSIKPVKASGLNGKKPALYREYWRLEKRKDYGALKEEIRYGLSTAISVDYYLSHPSAYEKDRKWVIMLSRYLKERRLRLAAAESVNERSFEIWNQEKFLTKGPGNRILKRCGLGLDDLNVYRTTEPLPYYSRTRKVPQNLLIVENKDTFYSMRRCLLGGGETILGVPFGTLIYGAGKGIIRSFEDFGLCVEPYMTEEGNRIYYFGDLDYEGIGIYESLAEMFGERWEIAPFVPAYERMLTKAAGCKGLPDTKEQQNRGIRGTFFSYFAEGHTRQMKHLLELGKYIPQEILNISDFGGQEEEGE